MAELYKLVGSLDIFGGALQLVQGLRLGVWHLIAMPAQGAAHGSVTKFLAGLVRGLMSMVSAMGLIRFIVVVGIGGWAY